MVSFDLSTTNILLTVAVVGLFALFIVLLVKLNPTKEEENTETATEVEEPMEPMLHETLPTVRQHIPEVPPPRVEVPRPVERLTVMEKPLIVVSPTPGGPSVQASRETKTPGTSYAAELARQAEKSPQSNRLGNTLNKKDCAHHFGYLRTFPKNSPIPDECFGCEKIVDCLVNKNDRKERR